MVQSWNINTLESLQRRERHPALKHAAHAAAAAAAPTRDRLAARRLTVPYDAPATRLAEQVTLPFKPNVMLTEAAAVLRGVRDGQAELLMYDLTGTHILASHEYRPQSGMLTLHLLREDSAANYQRVLRSLRYINRAALPSPGLRSVLLRVTDLTGDIQHVHAAALDVLGAPDGADARMPNADREPTFAGLAAQALPGEVPVPSDGAIDDGSPPDEPSPTVPEAAAYPIAETPIETIAGADAAALSERLAASADAIELATRFAADGGYRVFAGGADDAALPPWPQLRRLLADDRPADETGVLAEARTSYMIFAGQKRQLPADDLGFDVVDAAAAHVPLRDPANDQRAPRRPLTMEDMFEADVGEGELGHYFGQPLDGRKIGPVALAIPPGPSNPAPPIAVTL